MLCLHNTVLPKLYAEVIDATVTFVRLSSDPPLSIPHYCTLFVLAETDVRGQRSVHSLLRSHETGAVNWIYST